MRSPPPEEKLRLGGMALRNGLLVHGPTHWAAAVRDRRGQIQVASGRKPSFGGRATEGVPGVRGVTKLAEGDGGDPAGQARAAGGAAADAGPAHARRDGRGGVGRPRDPLERRADARARDGGRSGEHNNDGYGTMRQIRDGCFNVITRWNYGKICELVGGGSSTTVFTKGELDDALRTARRIKTVRVIEIKIPRDDISPQLARISREVAKMRGLQKTGTRDRKHPRQARLRRPR